MLTRNRCVAPAALTALVIFGRRWVGLARLATCRPLQFDCYHDKKESARRADADLTNGAPSGMTSSSGVMRR